MNTVYDEWRGSLCWSLLLILVGSLLGTGVTAVQAQNRSVAPIVRLIEAGEVAADRLPFALGLICKRGDADDLAFVFRQTTQPDVLTPEARFQVLELLAQTTRERQLKPAGELSGINTLLEQGRLQEDAALQRSVLRLIGLWEVRESAEELAKTLQQGAPPELTEPLISTLAALQGEAAIELILPLTVRPAPRRVRRQAIATLAELDLSQAAVAAADYLADAKPQESLGPLLQPFLARPRGPELLGEAISQREIPADIAKLTLRTLLTSGRQHEVLVEALGAAAGLENALKPLSPVEMVHMQKEIRQQGDAARGERIFRREELSCYKCHSLGQAGGNVGPDLSPIGGTSPLDYLINSILLPSEAIKEAYKTVLIVDGDGLTHVGIVVDRDADRVILRDAQGKEKSIPVEDIELEKEGESLMPAGLTKFLTRAEFVDLIAFLAALGKEPEYSLPAEPTIFRWRIYEQVPAKVTGELFDDDSVRNMLFEYAPERWRPFYSLASGKLPFDEARQLARSDVVFVLAELQVTTPGHIRLQLPQQNGITLWLENERLDPAEWEALFLEEGMHRLLFRLETKQFRQDHLLVQITSGPAPVAQYSILSGE